MWIKIAARLRPFSHECGTKCLLPKSTFCVEVFPALLRFHDLAAQKEIIEVELLVRGPLKDFTVLCDLEKGHIRVFGETLDGYVRYVISFEKDILIHFEKNLKDGIRCKMNGKEFVAADELKIPIGSSLMLRETKEERLSLGMHKSQDFQLIQRRADLKEIFPFWMRLAEWIPYEEKSNQEKGMFSLLGSCERVISSREITRIVPSFLSLYLAGFEGILVPRVKDGQHQGIVLEEDIPSSISSLALLKEGATLIRSLFFKENKEVFSFLPALPPEFHAGRMRGIKSLDGDLIDLEWSKKILRRACIKPSEDKKVQLELQKGIKSFRVRRSLKEKGFFLNAHEVLFLEKGQILYIDSIQK